MLVALQIVALLIVAATFLPLVRSDVWMIRGWDFPRVQVFLLGAVVLAALLAQGAPVGTWGWLTVVALLISILALALWMRPYTKLSSFEVLAAEDRESALKLLVSNVLMSNRNHEALIETIRRYDPDLLVALETDAWWRERLSVLEEDYPHAVEVPQDDTYGMIVRSRLPLHEPKVEYLVRDNIPSVHAGLILRDGTTVRLHALHPKPPFPDEATSSTDRDAELLIVGKRITQHDGPAIVLGDLNDVAWSRTTKLFQKISGLLDPRIGRGFYSTFHAGHWWMRWPLDHIFISDHFQVRHLKRLESIGSDHFPMFADLAFLPEENHCQEGPEANGDDVAEAEEKIAAAGRDSEEARNKG